MKARVVHLITKLELGGAQGNTLHTVRHLDRSRFSVALWAGDGGILNREAEAIPDLDFEIIPPLVREIAPVRDLQTLLLLWRKLKAEIQKFAPLPVILHTHSSKAGILGRLAGRLVNDEAAICEMFGKVLASAGIEARNFSYPWSPVNSQKAAPVPGLCGKQIAKPFGWSRLRK